MAYRVEVGGKASAQLSELDATIGSAVERKIIWLAKNADVMVHRRLVGMPDDLARLCKLRVGDWRILVRAFAWHPEAREGSVDSR
jgi:mRNA-degrading endonuclease RelE of RelBE toxin-antitoxin system